MINLSRFDHLRSEKMIQFKEEVIGGLDVTIVSYMVASPDLWKQSLAIECRGITFNTMTGECICRPFHKFFNIGENEHTLPENIPWDTLVSLLEKRDGSMITPILINETLYWKTKKSFYSDVAVEAASNTNKFIERFSAAIIRRGYTPVFEYTSPTCEIVINYGSEPQFVLLAVRDMQTGAYMPYAEMALLAETFNVKCIKAFPLMTYSELAEQMKTIEDFEGYVLRFDGYGMTQLNKQKSDWYFRMHRVKTDLRERDVADMCIEETLDDVKSVITAAGLSLAPIEEIENRISLQISDVVVQVKLLLNAALKMDNRKDVALAYKDHPLFGLLMNAYIGKEPDYKKYWVRNFRDGYNLRTRSEGVV